VEKKTEVLERFLYRFAPLFYLVTVIAVYIRSGKSINNFAFVHWFVTYENGYIKRGLAGTLLQVEWLAAALAIPAADIVHCVSLIVLGVFYLSIVVICSKISRLGKTTFIILPVVLTSASLAVVTRYTGYLDHLVFLLIIAAAFLLMHKLDYFAILLCGLGMLIHESMIVFCVPLLVFFILINTFLSGQYKIVSTDNKRTALLLLAMVLLLLCLLILQSYWISIDGITNYLTLIYKRNGFWGGPGNMVDVFSKSFVDWYASESPYFLQRVFSVYGFISTVIPVLFINTTLYFLIRSRYEYATVFYLLASLTCLTPVLLFLVAWDYDRIWSYPVILCIIFIWLVSNKVETAELPRTHAKWLSTSGLFLTLLYVSLPLYLDNVDLIMRWVIFSPILFMSFCGVLISFRQEAA
jgi:hypothetical protein